MDKKTTRASIDHPMAAKSRMSTKQPIDLDNKSITGAQQKMQELQAAETNATVEKIYNPVNMKNLKDLIFLGYSEEAVDIHGYKFLLKTLNGSERRDLVQLLALKGANMSLYIKAYTLAMAVVSVNSVPIEEVYESEEELLPFDRAVAFIDELQPALSDYLYKKYESLSKRSDDIFKDPETAEEADLDEHIKK